MANVGLSSSSWPPLRRRSLVLVPHQKTGTPHNPTPCVQSANNSSPNKHHTLEILISKASVLHAEEEEEIVNWV